jgi:two-component system chemotaxis sensor kinase CheA
MNALLAQFIPEARDLLERASDGVLALEARPQDGALVNDVFRAVHTLKGTSGLFEVAPLTRLVHAAEDLLEQARAGDLALDGDHVDALLGALDVVTRWVDALERQERLPEGAEDESAVRSAAIRKWLAPDAAVVAIAPRGAADTAPAWVTELPEAGRLSAFHAVAGGALTAFSFQPEEDCFFRGDDPLAMVRHAPGMHALAVAPCRELESLDALDPLQCWLTFRGLSDAGAPALAEHFRYVSEHVEIVAIRSADLAQPRGVRGEAPVFRDFATLARRLLGEGDEAAFTRAATALMDVASPASLQASALRWMRAYVEASGLSQAQELERLIAIVETGLTGGPPPFVQTAPPLAERVALEQIEALETPGPAPLEAGRFEATAQTLRALFAASGRNADQLAPALVALRDRRDGDPLRALLGLASRARAGVADATPSDGKSADAKSVEGPGLPRVLRVDQAKIDTIMNLVAELIVAKNGLSYLADRVERELGAHAMAREIKDSYAGIDRITQGLQLGVMSVRMMPVNQVLQRFPRLVRDVSRTLHKKVELVIEGEDTEADKNVLESLADPLIHIVRNSLDHGLETPEERRAAGKPEHGTVRIAARNESDFVVIEVTDDGRGIDVTRVRAKAVERGIVAAERAREMTDAEAANLIFLPGFSTKDEVSDLSGRGVGMDVVRSTVQRAGGEVSLRNTPGAGSTVQIRLPLTMAVTRIVTVDCGGRLFGIAMDAIAETVRLPQSAIKRIGPSEAFVLRDVIVPIVRLAERLGMDASRQDGGEAAVMVVNIGGELVGLVVDNFRERMETVVKPLNGILEGVAGFTGTALLGDGRVLLILDLPELI